jgi:hypothetical protein
LFGTDDPHDAHPFGNHTQDRHLPFRQSRVCHKEHSKNLRAHSHKMPSVVTGRTSSIASFARSVPDSGLSRVTVNHAGRKERRDERAHLATSWRPRHADQTNTGRLRHGRSRS